MQDRLAVIGLKHRISPQHFQLMKIHNVRCTGSPQWTLLRKRKANLFFSSTILGLSVVKKEKKKRHTFFMGLIIQDQAQIYFRLFLEQGTWDLLSPCSF